MGEKDKLEHFEQAILPHLDAAYNLARWLTRNEHDAQDMVQEAYMRAFKFFDGFHGADARAWLLTIVRNTCYTWLDQNRARDMTTPFDEEIHTTEDNALNPSAMALKSSDMEMLKQSLEQLPAEFREVIVLRDLEEFSYKNRRRDQHSFGHGHVAPGARPRAAQAHSVRSAEGETVNGL